MTQTTKAVWNDLVSNNGLNMQTFSADHIPYAPGTPKHTTCVAFVNKYNDIAKRVQMEAIPREAGMLEVANAFSGMFAGASPEKFSDFTKKFFKSALSSHVDVSRVSKQFLERPPSDMALDTALAVDLILGSAMLAVSFPFRLHEKRMALKDIAERTKVMSNVDASVQRVRTAIGGLNKAMVNISRADVIPPGFSEEFDQRLNNIKNEIDQAHKAMDVAHAQGLLGAMPEESFARIARTSNQLQNCERILRQTTARWQNSPDSPFGGKLEAFQEFVQQGEFQKIDIRTQTAAIDFDAKNVKEILAMRIASGERTLRPTDIAVIENAHARIAKGMTRVENILMDNPRVADEKDLQMMERFRDRMSDIRDMLNQKKHTDFMPEELKEKLKNLINPEALDKLSNLISDMMEKIKAVFTGINRPT